MSASKYFAVIAGAGPGTGRSIALRFAKAYPAVVLLARRPESYQATVDEINAQYGGAGRALGISADVSDEQSVAAAFDAIRRELPGHGLAAAVYNVGGGLARKPFLDLSVADINSSLEINGRGFFLFAKSAVPLLLESASSAQPPQHGAPTLIATGATAAMRGGAHLGSFAAGMFARRALAQSLAREFGPKGVHVAHAIIDGVIDIPRSKDLQVNQGVEDSKISPDAIAENYWLLHSQHRSAFTQELDIRPAVEKF